MGKKTGKGKGGGKHKGNVEVGPAPEGSIRQHLENLQNVRPEDRVGVDEDDVFDQRAEEEKVKGKKSASGRALNELLNLGKMLDRPSEDPVYWRDVVGVAGKFKMPRGDVWAEQHLKIRTKLGDVKLIRLNPAQLRYSRDCAEKASKRNIVLKARQVGMTSYIAARFFLQTITRKGALTMLVAHDRLAAEEIFRIVHRFWDNLAEKLQTGPLKTSHSSARELVFPRLDSEFTVASADENAGRGRTIQNLHCTEVSRWGRGAEEALASLRAAVVPGGEVVLESTAKGAGGLFYEEWQRAGETGYTTHFFPWWFEDAYVCEPGPSFQLTEEEAELAENHGLRADQLAWRRHQWAALRGLALQEFAEDPVSCFRASGECVFDLNAVERAFDSAGEPVESHDNGRLLIWLPRQERRYVIGVDPAGGGIEGDFSCAQVIDREKGIQCAELHGHYPPKELADELVRLGRTYNMALIAVESNNHGGSVLANLHNHKYPNIYRHNDEDGWATSAQSKPVMIENLAWALAEEPRLFKSIRLLSEFRTFVRLANGTTGGAHGTHDDCVMAMAVAWAARADDAGKGLFHASGSAEKPNNLPVAGVTGQASRGD